MQYLSKSQKATVSTNPATLLGFGTWAAFGAGRVAIGDDGSSFVAGATGGSADAIVVSHTHTASSSVTDPGHTHTHNLQIASNNTSTPGGAAGAISASTGTINSATTGITVSTTVNSTGSSGTNANLQPYVVVYMWRRTA